MFEILTYGMTVAQQVAILFILILIGYFIAKFKLMNRTGIDQIIDILLYIVTPLVIINSCISVPFNQKTVTDLGIATLCAAGTHFVGIIFAMFFKKVKPLSQAAVYRNGIIFSNGGFMGIPLVKALTGDYGVFLVSGYVIVLNVLAWMYGVRLFPEGKKSGRLRAFINPGSIGVLIGLPLFFFVQKVPEVIAKPVEYIAGLNTPVAMIVMGFFLLGSGVLEGIKDWKMWLVTLIRLAVIPLCMLVIFKYAFGLEDTLLIACMVSACAPCAINNMMLSAKFGGDTALATRMISFSTIVSIFTMPIVLALTQL